jgi:hypothetical protein
MSTSADLASIWGEISQTQTLFVAADFPRRLFLSVVGDGMRRCVSRMVEGIFS